MNSSRKRPSIRPQDSTPTVEWPEKMKLSQAAKFLGVSFSTMSNLIGSGKIKYQSDVLDRRIKLVKRSELEELLRNRNSD